MAFEKTLIAGAISVLGFGALSGAIAYETVGNGTRLLQNRDGVVIRMLVEESNLDGKEVEVGHITLPPGLASRTHRHGTTEIFYVLSGELEHVVGGESTIVKPGMVAIVRASDEVIHRVRGPEPVEALVIWAPGGEAARLGFESRPLR